MLDPADLKIEDAHRRGMLMEERRSDYYIDLMADTHLILNHFDDVICRNELMDVQMLRTRESNIIWCTVPYGSQKFDLPYDFEFVTQLEQPLAEHALRILKDDVRHLSLPNQRIILELKHALNGPFGEKGELQVFEEVRGITQQALGNIEKARLFKGGRAELNKLHHSFALPVRTHFKLLLVKKILEHPRHPRYRETLARLKHSYYKGSVKAYNQNLRMLFIALSRISEMLSRRAEEIIQDPIERTKRRAGAQRAWYSSDPVFTEEEDKEPEYSPLARYWLSLQRLPFSEVRKNWRVERFESMQTRLAPTTQKIGQVQAEALARVIWELQEKIKTSSEKDSLVFTSLRAEVTLGLRAAEDYEKAKSWIWSNRLKLVHMMHDLIERLDRARQENKDLQLPDVYETSVENAKKFLEGGSETARRQIQEQLDRSNPASAQQTYGEILEWDEDDAETILVRLAALYRNLADSSARIALTDVDWYAKLRAAYPRWRDMETQVVRIFKFDWDLEDLRVKTEVELADAYQRLDRFAGIPDEDFELCLDILARRHMQKLQSLDLDSLIAANYQARYELAVMEEDLEECLVQLNLLFREMEALPEEEHLDRMIAMWEGDLGKDDTTDLRDLITQNLPVLKALKDKIRESIREALQKGGEGNTAVRLLSFGLHHYSAAWFRAQFKELSYEAGRMESIKAGINPGKRMAALRDQLLKAQGIFRPEKDDHHAVSKLVDMEFSDRLRDLLFDDLTENAEALKVLKKEADKGYKRIRRNQQRFGAPGDIGHLDLSLGLDDVETLKKRYNLKEDTGQEDLQRFGASHIMRGKTQAGLFEKLNKNLITPDPEIPEEIGAFFTKNHYRAYIKNRTIPVELKAGLLYYFAEYMEAEAHLFANFLNFASPTGMLEAQTFTNILAIFKQVSVPKPQLRIWLARLWGRMQIHLHNFKPESQIANYDFNRDIFFKETKKIIGSKLDRK
ncbi:MAG: hypothetical protein QNK37_12100 [Acidobacteriota bacterium]|nr:hypothetical protein [Acidobacteriota bacterium]